MYNNNGNDYTEYKYYTTYVDPNFEKSGGGGGGGGSGCGSSLLAIIVIFLFIIALFFS